MHRVHCMLFRPKVHVHVAVSTQNQIGESRNITYMPYQHASHLHVSERVHALSAAQ